MASETLKKYSRFSRKNPNQQGIKVNFVKKQSSFMKFFTTNKIKSSHIVSFTRQLATMTTAGIPIIQSLDVLTRSSDNITMNNLILNIKAEIQSGYKISSALANHPQYFDQLYCALIEAGEESGSLNIMFARLADYMEKTECIKRKIKKAFFYPAAVIAIGIVVSSILLLKVLPEFKSLFNSVGVKLPAFTQFVLNISDWTSNNFLGMLISFIMLVIIYYVLYKKNLALRVLTDKIKLKTPIIGMIYVKSILARFSRTLATTFSSGMPLVASLKIVSKSPDNLIYQKGIDMARIEITEGKSLHRALETTRLFPNIMIQMISIGEETGELEQMLNNTAKIYEEEVDHAIDSLSTLIEPIIMTVLGVLVGSLVIAMYLPIFQLSDVVSK